MATFLAPGDYPSIRAALDISIDEVVLPDNVIGLSMYIDGADEEVKRRVPDYASKGSTDQQRMKNAAVYLCAARIAPSIPDIIRERRGQFQEYQREPVDWSARAEALRVEASKELSLVVTGGNLSSQRPCLFGRAPGGRGE